MLMHITRLDFGFDLQAWHNHLKESRQGGYTYGRNIVLPALMKKALASETWQNEVAALTLHDARSRSHDRRLPQDQADPGDN